MTSDHRDERSKENYVIVRGHYKIEDCYRLTRHATKRYIVVLEIGADSGFLKHSFLQKDLHYLIRLLKDHISFKDAKVSTSLVPGTSTLLANIGSLTTKKVSVNVVGRLSADIMFKRGFHNSKVKATGSQWRLEKPSDSISVPILKDPPKRLKDLASLRETKNFVPPLGRVTRKKCVIIQLPFELNLTTRYQSQQPKLI